MNVKAVAFCALVMMASPAAAQSWGPYGAGPYGPGPYVSDAVSLHQIHATLRAHGMEPITRPVQSWPYVVVRAADPYGQVVRVLLNARYGNIVQVIPLPSAPVLAERGYPPPGAYPYPPPAQRRYSDVRPDLKVEPDPVGPGVVYGSPPPYGDPHAHAAPPRPQDSRASVTPPRTPMPRPRPAQATATAKVETPASAAPAAAAPSPAASAAAPETAAAPPAAAPAAAAPVAETAKPSFPPTAPLE